MQLILFRFVAGRPTRGWSSVGLNGFGLIIKRAPSSGRAHFFRRVAASAQHDDGDVAGLRREFDLAQKLKPVSPGKPRSKQDVSMVLSLTRQGLPAELVA